MPYTCPRCGMTSHNPEDEKRRYCGNCHDFYVEMPNGQTVGFNEISEKIDSFMKRGYLAFDAMGMALEEIRGERGKCIKATQ